MSERPILEFLETIRQNSVDESEQFVLDFLDMMKQKILLKKVLMVK